MNGRLYMYMYHQSDLWRTIPLTVFNDFIFIHMYIIQMPKLFENDVVKFQHNAKGSRLYRGSQKIMMTLLSQVTQDCSILVVQTVIKTYTDPK